MKKIVICLLAAFILIGAPAGHAVPAMAAQTEDGAGRVSEMIGSLPSDSDLTLEDKGKVEEVRNAYDALTSAEKVRITNVARLTAAEQKIERLEEAASGAATAATSNEAQEAVPAVKTFTFDITQMRPQATVIIHYMYDIDEDGVNDVPSVTMTTPSGVQMQLTNIASQISTDALRATTIWAASQMQIDIEKAETGTWTITTSIPVTFETRDFAGARTDFDPNAEEPEPLPGDEKKGDITPFLMLGAAVLALVGIFAGPGLLKRMREGRQDGPVPSLSSREEPEDVREELSDFLRSQEAAYTDDDSTAEEEDEEEEEVVTQEDIDGDSSIEERVTDGTEDFTAYRKKYNGAVGKRVPVEGPEDEEGDDTGAEGDDDDDDGFGDYF